MAIDIKYYGSTYITLPVQAAISMLIASSLYITLPGESVHDYIIRFILLTTLQFILAHLRSTGYVSQKQSMNDIIGAISIAILVPVLYMLCIYIYIKIL